MSTDTLTWTGVPSVPDRPTRLAHVQALRGLAASLVVLSHTIVVRGVYPDRLWVTGYLGVGTFFVLSGFIIYRTSARHFGSNRQDFALRRALRIFPIYWLATALFVALNPRSYTVRDVMASLILFPTPMGDGMGPVVPQGWTLHYEVMFYALFAVGLLLPRRAGLTLIALALVGLVMGAQILPDDLLHYWGRPIVLLFLAGIAIALLAKRVRWTIPHAFEGLLAVIGLWFIYTLASADSESDHLLFPDVLIAWAFCIGLVIIAVFGRARGGRFEVMLERFGDASYSTYLFHTFVLSAFNRLHLNAHQVLYSLASVVVANVFGYGLYRLLEQPILTAGKRLLQSSSATA